MRYLEYERVDLMKCLDEVISKNAGGQVVCHRVYRDGDTRNNMPFRLNGLRV